jgi:peptidoglycan/LPS O-acetylase OafA/YrhL
MRFVGVLSYTLYLVHYPCLKLAAGWSSNRVIVGMTALSMSMALAYFMHILVEKPLARFRRTLGSRTAEVIDQPIAEVAAVG